MGKSKDNNKLRFFLRALLSLFGVIFIAIGATFLEQGMVGLDPFTATNIGLSKILGMGLGSVQLGFNIIIFIIILILDRKQMGLGTVFNMTLVGFGIQILSHIYNQYITGLYIPMLILDAFIGLVVFTLGTSMYMEASLGVAPYDAIAPIIVKKTHLKYQWVRSIQDLSFMVIGLLVHGDIGIMTIVIAFFAGPLISAWNVHFSSHIIYLINHVSGKKPASITKKATDSSNHQSKMNPLRKAFLMTNLLEYNAATYSSHHLTDLLTSSKNQLKMEHIKESSLQKQINIISNILAKRH